VLNARILSVQIATANKVATHLLPATVLLFTHVIGVFS